MKARSVEQLVLDSQRLLVEFLTADIDLAFTMLETSDMSSHGSHAIDTAKRAVETVRSLQGRIADPGIRKKIDEGLNKLGDAIKSRER